MINLNIGCGGKYKEGWINLDNNPKCNPDILHDLNKFPYPFLDNHFDEILASHILEHVDNILDVLDELYRISKPNAKIIIRVPHWSDHSSYSDFTHVRSFSSESFDYFERAPEYYLSKARFKINKKLLTVYGAGRLPEAKKNFFLLVFGRILDFVINLSQPFTEMFLCKFIPVSQAWFILKVQKEEKKDVRN